MAIFKISSTSSSPIHSSLILPSSLSPPVLPFTACNAGEPELHELMDGVPEALDSDKLYACDEQRSSRSWRSSRQASSEALAAAGAWGRRAGRRSDRRSLRPASKETLAAGGACGRGSSRPASKEAQRPAKLGTLEQGGAAAAGVRSPLLEIQSFQLVSGLHSELSEVQLASVVIYFSQITEPDLGCVL